MRRVSQERTIEVQLAGPDGAGQAADAIRRLAPDATDVAVSPAEAMVRFRSSLPDRALGAVLAGLVRAGVEVTQFRELPSDLEDAFLSVTRNDGMDAADAAPTAGGVGAGGRS
jgi:ABC-2 type transport system ATP-binding protein